MGKFCRTPRRPGEFRRTPGSIVAGGRDYRPPVFSVLVAGTGIKGCQVYGSPDVTGSDPKDNPVRVEYLTATIYDRLGIDPAREYHASNDAASDLPLTVYSCAHPCSKQGYWRSIALRAVTLPGMNRR